MKLMDTAFLLLYKKIWFIIKIRMGLYDKFHPKGTDFSKVTDEDFLRVQNLIHERLRKSLNYKKQEEYYLLHQN